MSAIDRLRGLVSSIAIKAPVIVATTGSNITLSGLQVVDGYTLLGGERVLVKDQTVASQNGIYVASNGAWTRDLDFINPTDCVQGTIVVVVAGTQYASAVFQQTTAAPVVGSSAITFAVAGAAALALASAYMRASILPLTTAALVRAALAAAGLADNNVLTGINSFAKLVITGGSSILPQGRLTLTTGTPVLAAAVLAATTLYYTPYVGNLVPIYDGTNLIPTPCAELSNITTNSAVGNAGPAAVTTNSNYDLFVWSNAGTPTLTRGPLWTSDTARGSGAGTTQLQMIDGVWTNAVAITNGPAPNLGTYVGTVRSDGSSKLNWQPGGSAAGGTAALLTVWNMYNRVTVGGFVQDSTSNWAYNTATWRAADNSNGNRVSFVTGQQEDFIDATFMLTGVSASTSDSGLIGIDLDSTSATPLTTSIGQMPGTAASQIAFITVSTFQVLGFHFLQAVENGNGSTGWSFKGGTSFVLKYSGRF